VCLLSLINKLFPNFYLVIFSSLVSFVLFLCFSYFMLFLPLISILSVLNKSIGSICGGGKQARTQGNMFRKPKNWFWSKYPYRAPLESHPMLQIKNVIKLHKVERWKVRLSTHKAERWKVRLSPHNAKLWKSGAECHSIHKTWCWGG